MRVSENGVVYDYDAEIIDEKPNTRQQKNVNGKSRKHKKTNKVHHKKHKNDFNGNLVCLGLTACGIAVNILKRTLK